MKESEMEHEKLTFLKNVNERMESRDRIKKVDDIEDRYVAIIADELRQLPHKERFWIPRLWMQILDKQNATEGNFNDQNVNNRNSFVSQLGYQLPLPFNSSHGDSFPIQQPHNQNYIIFEVQKTHIMLFQFDHLLTFQYFMETKQILNIYRM